MSRCYVRGCVGTQVPGSSFCALHGDNEEPAKKKLPKKIPSTTQAILSGRRETWITGVKDASRSGNKRHLKQVSIRLAELDEIIGILKREGLWNG